MDKIFNAVDTDKKVYANENYISFAKSILHLPIFQSISNNSGREKRAVIKIERFYAFQNVEMRFNRLSVNFDFDIFYFILLKKLKSDRLTFSINYHEFMLFHRVKSSNKKVYIEMIKKSLDNMMDFYLSFQYGAKVYKCHILSHIEEDESNRDNIKITFSRYFQNFYEHDSSLIFNFKMEEYRKVKSEYAKVLYMFYLTNRYQASVEYSLASIITRLDSSSFDRKEVLKNITKAHKELIALGFIKSVTLLKKGKFIDKYRIVFEKSEESKVVSKNNKVLPLKLEADSAAMSIRSNSIFTEWYERSRGQKEA